MAVASLRYDATSNVDETRQGIFVYNGAATRFHEWEFRTRIRWSSSKDEDKPRAMAQIVEGLRGEAALTAMDVGLEALMGKDGLVQPSISSSPSRSNRTVSSWPQA